jgi:DMSO/TMAO reductase YedYZ molybdopterin-dependent catalytic subunit
MGSETYFRKSNDEAEGKPRVPPGQYLTDKFPVLHYGGIPNFDPKTWRFQVYGEVEKQISWSWPELTALPSKKIITDIHCVTTWSKLDTQWEGISFLDLAKLVNIKKEAAFVIAHCDGGYSANLPLERCMSEDVLLAFRYNGKPLEPEHGYPLRLLVPQLYLWKSAKWLRALEFRRDDQRGFWERYGYHNEGDPWKEQRFAED